MCGISKHAALEVGSGNGRKAEGAGETLVSLGVVVLKADLDLDGFGKVALLPLDVNTCFGDGFAGGEGKNVLHGLLEELGIQFVRHLNWDLYRDWLFRE